MAPLPPRDAAEHRLPLRFALERFERRVKPMNDERRRLLDDCREVPDRPPLLEQILFAFLKPAFDRSGGSAFIRLRGRMAIESSDLARRLAAESFDETSGRFLRALARALPGLSEIDLFWRFHFLLGAQVYTMANPGRIQSLSGGACDPGDSRDVMRHLVPFVAAGFRAPGIVVPGSEDTDRRASAPC